MNDLVESGMELRVQYYNDELKSGGSRRYQSPMLTWLPIPQFAPCYTTLESPLDYLLAAGALQYRAVCSGSCTLRILAFAVQPSHKYDLDL